MIGTIFDANIIYRGPVMMAEGNTSPNITTNPTDSNMAAQSGAMLFSNIGKVSFTIELATNRVDNKK